MATFSRNVTVDWQGSIMEGSGQANAGTGAFSLPVTFPRRIGDPQGGTSPEELIAAAHAGCFSMAFSGNLAKAGFTPTSVRTTANVTVEKVGDGFTITRINLDTVGQVPGISEDKFMELAEAAKKGCPVSRLVTGAEVTMKARLEK